MKNKINPFSLSTKFAIAFTESVSFRAIVLKNICLVNKLNFSTSARLKERSKNKKK